MYREVPIRLVFAACSPMLGAQAAEARAICSFFRYICNNMEMAEMTMIVSKHKSDPREPWRLCYDMRPCVSGTPFTSVVAQGVRFGDSPYAEKGFGARRVAFCDGAQGYGKKLSVPSHCFRIEFDGYNFVDPDGKPYEKCDTMYFMHDGKMFGAMYAETQEAQDVAA
jgi:hypothetical protein